MFISNLMVNSLATYSNLYRCRSNFQLFFRSCIFFPPHNVGGVLICVPWHETVYEVGDYSVFYQLPMNKLYDYLFFSPQIYTRICFIYNHTIFLEGCLFSGSSISNLLSTYISCHTILRGEFIFRWPTSNLLTTHPVVSVIFGLSCSNLHIT